MHFALGLPQVELPSDSLESLEANVLRILQYIANFSAAAAAKQ